MMNETQRRAIQSRLLAWYRREHRELPWRETRDPYRILVSEIMLQQTQAERVAVKYTEFLHQFPTLHALADAPASAVIRAWAGLGYNRRALNLHRACRDVVERWGGTLPATASELQTLPGIGPYTAGAVACFAYGADVAFVDTNIRRVLQRVARGPEHPAAGAATPRQIQELAQELLPAGEGYAWNQALMELGATLCRARNVDCARCPLADICAARPTIETVLRELPRQRLAVTERFEQTSRYARGRIIDALRSASDSGLRAAEIGAAVRPGSSDEDVSWLMTHLAGLVADGLVAIVAAESAVREDSPSYNGESGDAGEPEVRYTLPS